MPGLATLKKAKTDQISINYTELAAGAQITYETGNPELIHAIHQWFDAQLSDHAGYAMSNHPRHHLHNNSTTAPD